jgi:NAD/NADP transhydrogenase beta subunit
MAAFVVAAADAADKAVRAGSSDAAAIDNPLFYMDKTMIVCGEAREIVEHIVRGLD